ncbi:hypothetical protein NC99_04190 [Sunxiuqinia dokdonensis]|uniref:Uncharacterized protein n=1 Tax=Sunxiuqinia dokdonensis TaxID=1409788 RepID=A0A0L8VEJ7_9BACT|nr:hypothetical protein NC99_04190 [Sunxiuqinia dokdonensis]
MRWDFFFLCVEESGQADSFFDSPFRGINRWSNKRTKVVLYLFLPVSLP